jgi:5'-3' exonuclease
MYYAKCDDWASGWDTAPLAYSPSWDWYYPYNYALHANDFEKYMPVDIYKFYWPKSYPSHPHEQLLRVIPPISIDLIPPYLHSEFLRIAREATTFKLDKSGKREEWEAVTIVDFVNPQVEHYGN